MAFGIAVLFSFHYMSRRCVHAVAQANRLTMYFRRIKIDLCNLNEAAEVMHMKVLIEKLIILTALSFRISSAVNDRRMKNDVRVVWVLFAK
ncbi:hypothetical protein T03_15579 [Trichinella britovi]|uniref:Uncharacterized protein n=1 Tax=Trichinella britovi TaxID=45882 RepID=A0A0V1CX33_TRIBR|nr:hypothetical protein T03_15579 [Trichinella britovi]